MTDTKKDLTSLTDYAKALQDAGTAAPAPAGSVMHEQILEKIDDFESLEDYGKAHPTPEATFEAAPEIHSDDFPTTPVSSTESQPGLAELTLDRGDPEEAFAPEEENFVAPVEAVVHDFSSEGFSPPDSGPIVEPLLTPAEVVEPSPIPEPLRPAIQPPATSAPQDTMERVRQYSEQMTPGRAAVPASFPFSLLITGHLAAEERERLLDILAREQMGIREIDLEPQFEGGKILIPRISEYAGVLLVSALRSTAARMRLGPSDTIFATQDTQEADGDAHDDGERQASASGNHLTHLAENIPITTQDSIPGLTIYTVIDLVSASAALKSQAVETEATAEFQDLLDALSREIKYKAFHKGACAILNFTVQLTALSMTTHYRLLVTGSAVKRTGG